MKNRSLLPKLVLFVMVIFSAHAFFFSCRHESEDISNIREICFEDEIYPIFLNSCGISGCHDNSSAAEGYIFNSYSTIVSAVNPGDSKSSPAYIAIISSGEKRMPPNNPLPIESRQLIRIWIEQGAQNTTCKDTGNNDPGDPPYVNPRACFGRDILPVLRSSCAISGCHDAATQAGEYIFTDYPNTIKSVVPGNPNSSELYEKITETEPGDRMPPEGYDRLAQAQIDSIYKWILYGALDEECGESCDTTSVITYSNHVWPIIQTNCKGCHSGTNPSGGKLLTTYAEVSAQAGNGTLQAVLRGTSGKPLMPPSGSLPECSIRQIEIWIVNGSQNN